MSSDRKKREKEQNQKAKRLKKEAKEKKRFSDNPNINPFAALAEEPEPEPEPEPEEEDEGDIVNLPPSAESDKKKAEDMMKLTPNQIRKQINDIIEEKTKLLIPGPSGVIVSDKTQIKKIMKNIVDNLIQRDSDYKKYKLLDTNDVKELEQEKKLSSRLLDVEMMPALTKDEQLRGQLTNIEYNFQKSKEYIKNLGQKMVTQDDVDELLIYFDNIYDATPTPTDKKFVKENELLELGELIKNYIGLLYKKEEKEKVKGPLVSQFADLDKRVSVVLTKIPQNKIDKNPRILKDKTNYEDIKIDNENTMAMMKQAAQERLARQKAQKVRDPASGMEVKNPASGEVKMAPSGEMVFMGKLGSKENPILIGAEEKKEERYIPLPVVGTDYQGSKEMFVKQEQKPLEPFGGLQSQNEVEAPYLSTKSDKDIGNVRSVGFVGAMDQLAKVEDVTMEPSERSKSLKRFTNFRWVQSVQNSDLGYASPFQRMDDIDDRRRFGNCFMHANKMPKDADTQDELDKAKAFNTYSLVPSFDLSSRMQPATPLSFINSTSKFARKVTGDEMEPINQGKRNVSNLKNKLEFTTLLHSDDPLMRIKDKYKNNIVC